MAENTNTTATNGEEKLIAVARHIAKTLGHTDTMADDILQIFSNFDGRFRDKLNNTAAHNEEEERLRTLERHVTRYVSSDHPIWSNSADSSSFLDSVDQLLTLLRHVAPPQGVVPSPLADRAEELLQRCMFRLEVEFKSLMETSSRAVANSDDDDDDDVEDDDDVDDIPIASPLTSFNFLIDALPPGTINDLNEIAKRMVPARYGKECSHAYSISRRDFLEESLSRLGLHKNLTVEEVHKMPWSDLEDEIEKWNKAANVSLHILFPSERRLCDRVFFGLVSSSDLAFMEVCRGPTTQLLTFADAIAIGSRAPERLFKVLDVYETLRDLMPEFESVFSDQYCVCLRNEAMAIWKRLGESIRGIFMELENLIRRDPAKASVPGGGLHPITRYVMNYLRAACRSRQTLEQVFEESMGGPGLNSSSLSVQMSWIMELLESNLEAKAKVYRDPALCSVFMMNNGRYIVQKVRDNELGSLLGDDWVRKNTAKVRQYRVNYQRSSWNKVIGLLKLDDNSTVVNNGASRVMKEKLKAFNSCFDEIFRNQSTWVIFDEQLREDLKISAIENLSPPYRSFLGKFQTLADIGRHERYIKYTVEELEGRINELFQGSIGSNNGRK